MCEFLPAVFGFILVCLFWDLLPVCLRGVKCLVGAMGLDHLSLAVDMLQMSHLTWWELTLRCLGWVLFSNLRTLPPAALIESHVSGYCAAIRTALLVEAAKGNAGDTYCHECACRTETLEMCSGYLSACVTQAQ